MEAIGARRGRKLWRRRATKRYYTWDSLHGEVEVWDRNGWHLGAVDALTGKLVKEARKGRRIDV